MRGNSAASTNEEYLVKAKEKNPPQTTEGHNTRLSHLAVGHGGSVCERCSIRWGEGIRTGANGKGQSISLWAAAIEHINVPCEHLVSRKWQNMDYHHLL